MLQAGGGVILLLQWPAGAPGPSYDLPDNLPDNDDLQNGTVTTAHNLGHVVALVGFDDLPTPPNLNDFFLHDPANNGGTHLWPRDLGSTEIRPFYDLGKLSFYPEVTIAGTPAAVVGALLIETEKLTPALAPLGLLALLGVLLGVGAWRLRR